jgi:hypothetical protein
MSLWPLACFISSLTTRYPCHLSKLLRPRWQTITGRRVISIARFCPPKPCWAKFGPYEGWCAFYLQRLPSELSANICSHDSIHRTRSLTHPSFIPTRSQSQPVVDASAQTQDIPPISTPSDEPVSDFQAQQMTKRRDRLKVQKAPSDTVRTLFGLNLRRMLSLH